MPRQGSSGVLLTGIAVSLAVHAAIAAGFVQFSPLLGPSAPPGQEALARAEVIIVEPEPEPEPAPERLRLGIEGGSPDRAAWLGFQDETEHSAPEGPTDQSAMALTEAAGSPLPDEPVPSAAPPLPPVSLEPLREWTSDVSEAVQRLAESVRQAVMLAADAVAELTEEPEQAQAVAEAPSVPESPPSPTEVQSPSPATGGAGAEPHAIRSDRESMATAIRHAPAVRPGRVLAADGLEIQTRRPQWSYVTTVTRRPRNPTVEIFFGPDGRVRRAAFATDGVVLYNTGFDDVDQPLLNAIYAWTARGRQLAELSENDELRILITIILAG